MVTHFTNNREARAFLSAIAEPGDQELVNLVRTVGPVSAAHLIVGGAEVEPSKLSDLYRRLTPRIPHTSFIDELKRWQDKGVRFDVPGDPGYPIGLNDLAAPPLGLWRKGHVSMSEHHVGFVGARASTSYGDHVTREFVGDLIAGKGDIGIVSGMAYGIDAAAHRAALDAGGKTIAFLAGGVGYPYPAGHGTLYHSIIEHGGVVYSELPPDATPTKWRFLARNRLIAAMSDAVIVVEAGARSGSMNTASHATIIDRPVGAVPGPITSAASVGCHALIRSGATAITSAEEIRELITID